MTGYSGADPSADTYGHGRETSQVSPEFRHLFPPDTAARGGGQAQPSRTKVYSPPSKTGKRKAVKPKRMGSK